MSQISLHEGLLERGEDAEDEAVKDLRRHMRKAAGLDRSEMERSNSEPILETARKDLLDPDIGRLRDVAQPGGFRRHSVKQQRAAAFISYAETLLVEVLVPRLRMGHALDAMQVAGDASNLAVGFVIAKNFFGSCFLITPKGFEEAGLAGGPVCLTIVYLMEVRCMLNLIKCRKLLGPDFRYEDLGVAIAPWFPKVIQYMIVLCQFGFCCIWLVSNAQNLSMIVPQWSNTHRLWIQLIPLFGLVWIRKLSVFAYTNAVGIGFTIFMVFFFFYFMSDHILEFGQQPVQIFNTRNQDWLLWLGTCAYAYEGINIVLPTYESATDKDAMPKLLVSITAFNTLVYLAFGSLTYIAFGTEVGSLATLNLPRGSLEGRAIPLVSVLIGLTSYPLQAFVIHQTYEVKVSWSNDNIVRKWQKNFTRSLLLLFTIGTTWIGGDQLQNFLALVGGFCCASLALIFPSILHILICKPRGIGLYTDAAITFAGIAILILSCSQAFASWK